MKLLIGADIVPTENNRIAFNEGNGKRIIDESLEGVIIDHDFRICNLETPLTSKSNPIPKCGPHHRANPEAVNGLKALKIDFCTLANNHIMDQGDCGLIDTIHTLEDNGISYAGVGENLKKMNKCFYYEKMVGKTAIFCCAEHEFSIATEKKMGVNPFDPLETYDDITKISENCDYLIVLYHGGKEYYRYPSPYLQKICRKFIEKGANLVVCQHSHCLGSVEKYLDGSIVYGQGNYVFLDEKDDSKHSVLLSVDVLTKEVKYIPILEKDNKICLANEAEALDILSKFSERSEMIQDKDFIVEQYRNFSRKMINSYLRSMTGQKTRSFCYRAINKLSKGRLLETDLLHTFGKSNLLQIQNYIVCEAHRELFEQGIIERIRDN